MFYFRQNGTNLVFAYESQEEYEKWGSGTDNLVKMTDEEIRLHLNPEQPIPTTEQVTEMRRLAYADPLTGSDILFIEYQKSIAMNESTSEIERTKTAWLTRTNEIVQQYPWPN